MPNGGMVYSTPTVRHPVLRTLKKIIIVIIITFVNL